MTACFAVIASKVNDLQVAFFPFAFGECFFEVFFGLFYATPVRKSPALGEAVDVGVHREGGEFKNVAHDDTRRLVTHTGQTFEFFKGVGYFTAEALQQFFGEIVEVHAFGVKEPAGFDDFCNVVYAQLDHFSGRVSLLEKDGCHLVHSDVCALRTQDYCYKQCERARKIQRDGRVREELVQLFSNEFDFCSAIQVKRRA